MVPKIGKNSSYGATVTYVMGPGKDNVHGRSEIIGGNMAGQNAESITKEFEQLALGREDVSKQVLHISLNANRADGKLSDEAWKACAEDFLIWYGLDPDKHPWMMVRHTDKKHDHVHLVVSRIGYERELFKPVYKDSLHAQRVCRRLEEKYGLTPTIQGQRSLDQGLIAEIRAKVAASRDASRGQGFDAFKSRLLSEHNIKTIEFRNQAGKLNGLQFQSPGHRPVKAGDLGNEFRTKNLMAELSPTTSKMSPTTSQAAAGATKAAGKVVGNALAGIKQMPKMPSLPRIPGLPGAGGLAGQLAKGLAQGVQSAMKQAAKAPQKRRDRDHELE